MKIQLAIEVFKRVFVWSTQLSVVKHREPEPDEEDEVEEHDVTSIPLGFHG